MDLITQILLILVLDTLGFKQSFFVFLLFFFHLLQLKSLLDEFFVLLEVLLVFLCLLVDLLLRSLHIVLGRTSPIFLLLDFIAELLVHFFHSVSLLSIYGYLLVDLPYLLLYVFVVSLFIFVLFLLDLNLV